MKPVLALAIALGLGVASSAGAMAQQVTAAASAPPTNSASAAVFAIQIREIMSTARQGAKARGLSGQPLELAVSQAVEALISTSGQPPATVLDAVQLAMAEEKCVLTPAGYTTEGCQAMADIASAVSAAIGGPAALGGTGAVASSAAAGPPRTSAGSDYGV